jgi:hypothetical protein
MICNKCENQNKCNNLTKKDYQVLITQKDYMLNQLNENKKHLKEYEGIFNEINNHDWKYTIPVNVYGTIKYAPRKNVFDVFIRKPEHVVYGWNLKRLERRNIELLECIRNLAAKEFELRRELS